MSDADQRFLFVKSAAVASEELRRKMLNTTPHEFLDEMGRLDEQYRARQ